MVVEKVWIKIVICGKIPQHSVDLFFNTICFKFVIKRFSVDSQ